MIKLISDRNYLNRRENEDYEEHYKRLLKCNNYNIQIGTLEECKEWVDKTDILEIDTETVKNFNDFSGHVFTFQVGNYDVQWVIDCTDINNHDLVKYILKTDKKKILQNAKYDLKWFLNWGINPTNIYDTMLMEVVLNTGYKIGELGVSLDKLGMRYVGIDISKTIRGQINYLGLVPEVIDYAAGDVKYLSLIREKQVARLKEADLVQVAILENKVVRVFAEMEHTGIYLDANEWRQVNKEYTKELILFEDKLHKYLASHPVVKYYSVSIDMFTGTKIIDMNFNSPAQMVLLLNRIGYVKKNKALIELTTAGEKEIEQYAYIDDFIGMYLDYKQMQTNVSKYGEKFLRAINPNSGRVHTNYWQILNTGRVSSGEKDNPLCPNMQNIPKYSDKPKEGHTKHRGCFKAKEGFSFVSLDFSSQELVLIAEDSQEPVWINALKNGWDLHSYVAEMVFKDTWKRAAEPNCTYYNQLYSRQVGNKIEFITQYDYDRMLNSSENNNVVYKATKPKSKCNCEKHKDMRDKIKTINYALSYGAGPKKIAANLRISVNAAIKIIDEYFSTMTRLRILFNTLAQAGVDRLFIRTFAPYRRKRYFIRPETDNEEHNIRRQSMNTRFQGTGADMMKKALVDLYDYLKPKYGSDCMFILQVHDQVVLEVKDEFAEEVKVQAIEIMRNVSKIMLKTLMVDVDGEITKIWKH